MKIMTKYEKYLGVTEDQRAVPAFEAVNHLTINAHLCRSTMRSKS